MNFKEFIFTEEIHPNDTATVYHRTKSVHPVSKIIQSGFQPGSGDTYGKGLYSTISLESQFNANMIHYGPIIVKFHVTNLDKYLVFHPNMAKRIHGQNNYKLSDQLNKFGLDHKFHKDYLNELDRQQELTGLRNASNFKDFYDTHNWIQNDPAIKGVIYYGEHDGYCLLKYEPVNDGTITMLGYAIADTSPETMRKLYNNEGWITSTNAIKIKEIEKLPYDRRSNYTSLLGKNIKTPLQLYNFLIKGGDLTVLDSFSNITNILDKKSVLNDKIIVHLLNRSAFFVCDNELLKYANNLDEIVKMLFPRNKYRSIDPVLTSSFLDHASNKLEMAKILGQENINKLSGEDVANLLLDTSDKTEMATALGSENINKLSGEDVYRLLFHASNKQEMANILGSENINKINNHNVFDLLDKASDKQEMAKIIIQYKTELSSDNVYNLLKYASNKLEMATALGEENINKLSDDNIYNLIIYASNNQEMVKALGSKNINKINNYNVKKLLNNASNKLEMAKIIIQYKKELSNDDITTLLNKAPDEQEMAKIIIQYKKELSNDDITTLLNKAPDKQEIAKIIIQNKKELSNDDITTLFEHTPKKQEIADLLGEKNIKELSSDNVYNLLKYGSDKQEMAKALGSENINKLSGDNVYNLLSYRLKLQEMADILGSENINKLSREHVFAMLYGANYLSEKIKIAKMIDQYYTNKTPEIEKLIQPYLQQSNHT